MLEMNACGLAYQNDELFHDLAGIYDAELLARMNHFLERHTAIKAQFLAEDAAGQR